MADIQYINYGDLQIEQLALLNNLSDNVYKYVLRQPWSNKKKEKFMSAYQDIMSRGVLGASNSTGEWRINVGGNVMPTMDKKDREMYEEAAYFIQLLMASLPTKTSEELTKEKEKSELPTFDNDAFTTDFRKYISSTRGGQSFVIDDKWNNLDLKRNEKGERERTERTKKLLGYLEGYKSKFDSSKYSFKDSPFENDTDFKLRLDKAIQALRSPELSDDNDALMSLGLNPEDWFNNGTGDVFTGDKEFNKLYEGKGTYGQYYNEYLPALLELKNKQLLLVKLEKKLNQYTRYQFYGAKPGLAARMGTPVRELYRGRELDYLKSLATKTDLTRLEVDELIGGFRLFEQLGKLGKLSKEELEKFGPSMRTRANNFRKIEGIEGFYWDPIALRIVRPINENIAPLTIDSLSIFDLNSPEALQLKYLNNTEFTDADWAELAGMAADIASIIDPEPWTAGGLGIAAAASRNYARTRSPEKWGFWDYASLAGDYLTGVAGAIPLLGDAALAAKTIKNIVPWLRRAMRVPAFLDLWNSTPEMVPIGKKLMNGEDLTVLDWMNLGTFVRGLATTRNLNVTNRASRKALLERGYEVSNRWDKKLGLTSSKPIGESTSPTLKIKIKGTEEEIPITPLLKEKLDEKLSKAGNNVEARSKIVREDADVLAAVEAHMKIKDPTFKMKEEVTATDGTKSTKISDDWNNATISYNESLRNARIFRNKFGLTPSWARTSGGIYGEINNPLGRGYDNFDNYIKSNRDLWDKFKYGSNRTLRRMDKLNEPLYGTQSALNVLDILYSGKIDDKTLRELNNAMNPSVHKTKRASRVINPKNSSVNGKLIDGSDYQVLFGKNTSGKEEMFLIINGISNKVEGNSLGEMKSNLGKMIKEVNLKILLNLKIVLNVNSPEWKNFVNSIKDLKRKGYLYLLGGRIDKLKIQIYKNYFKK